MPENPLIPKERPMLTTVAGYVTALSLIGGGIWYLGRPPFANETWVVAELTDRDLRYQQQREEQLEQRLFDLKYKEKVAPAPVKPLIKEDIERTNRQLERTRDEIKEMRKKK